MIRPGSTAPLGATFDGEGVNFAVYSGGAERVDLCLFDARLRAGPVHSLPACEDGVWHGYLPGCRPGQAYGYRVHGRYAPEQGLRFNAAKLLIDPYARALAGRFRWSPAVHDYDPGQPGFRVGVADSAPDVPKSVVSGPIEAAASVRPAVPWSETIIYEANVRGFTMRHPDLPDAERGRFAGLKNGAVLAYLRSLGITAIELMPVHAQIDERFLAQRGLRNLWGYNSINYFTPAARLARGDATREFRDMVDAIHDAGLEVLLDVAFNHTGEGDTHGPTLSFRGLDNLCYYRTDPDAPASYENHSGCGNTLNMDHPRVRALVRDSLCYWHRDMGVDGFRFDLATVLGRGAAGFDADHPMLRCIRDEPRLQGVKLIAEPWDVGPDGYRLGGFPPPWVEWNDRYRDSVRRFWRGDEGQLGEFARRVHGSADLFEHPGRAPAASVNFITAHDGFTLADLVSYERRHNRANGQGNRDGHAHNFSCNHGVEGPSDDPEIQALRRRQRLNMLATLLLSPGTPMLLAGDEFGNTQQGNNNAYAQDNDTGWLDWSGLGRDPDFLHAVRCLVRLRRDTPLFRPPHFLHGRRPGRAGPAEIEWLHPGGEGMDAAQWQAGQALALLLTCAAVAPEWEGPPAAALLCNAERTPMRFRLPGMPWPGAWRLVFASGEARSLDTGADWLLPPSSVACALWLDKPPPR